MALSMNLVKFRVQSFRSVDDSGWFDVDEVTALIGTNESGKSNLLLPLWKFNPAKDGEIVPTSDYPRKHFTAIRAAEQKPIFITAVFQPASSTIDELVERTRLPPEEVSEIVVSRRFDGTYEVEFPRVPRHRVISVDALAALIRAAGREVSALQPLKSESELASEISAVLLRAEVCDGGG
jgi:energy-coupling factor transporter ATP-binding protein EcfA2